MGKCVGCHVTKIGGWKPGRFLHILQFVMKQAKAFTRKLFAVILKQARVLPGNFFQFIMKQAKILPGNFAIYFEASQGIYL